jgi:acetolactate synthase regulatory subunit
LSARPREILFERILRTTQAHALKISVVAMHYTARTLESAGEPVALMTAVQRAVQAGNQAAFDASEKIDKRAHQDARR